MGEREADRESAFFNMLREVFIGTRVEGRGGFVNLMKIKSAYYRKIEALLRSDISNVLERFPSFREELFQKLYSFFSAYISENGSIYPSRAPFHNGLYERVYPQDGDTSLYWKTKDMYYIKSERILRSISVEVGGFIFYFDASSVENKRSNEKRSVSFRVQSVEGTRVYLTVEYREETEGKRWRREREEEGGRRVKESIAKQIFASLRDRGVTIREEDVARAIWYFLRQGEADYFLRKDPRTYLREQFHIWLLTYLLQEGVTGYERFQEMQALRDIGLRVIDFLSQFEEELVKVWNKPRFVRNSGYVVSLDRLGGDVLRRVVFHRSMEGQVREWVDLGLVEGAIDPRELLDPPPEYRFLPIDTRYFKDLEGAVLEGFEDLDGSLDGWLIHSENYQALNTILPKFRRRVQTVYIDPPFNKGQEAEYLYSVRYRDSTWATLMENKLFMAKGLLRDTGNIFVRCDHKGNWILRPIMDDIFGKENFRNEIVVSRTLEFFKNSRGLKRFMTDTDTLLFYGMSQESKFREIRLEREADRWWDPFLPGEPRDEEDRYRVVMGVRVASPPGRKWGLTQEQIQELEGKGRIRLVDGRVKFAPLRTTLKNNWTDIPGYSRRWGFPTENSEALLKRVIVSSSDQGDLVADFFLGSGTTTAVAHKLGRRWLGVEMGDHFHSVVMPRMKRVLAFDPSGVSKDPDVRTGYNRGRAGGFFKYYELEQYDQVLERAVYSDDPGGVLDHLDYPYGYYPFMGDRKLLDALTVQGNSVEVHLERIYPDVDLPETLSNLLGKWIRRVRGDGVVELEDGTVLNLRGLDYRTIAPLIWWD